MILFSLTLLLSYIITFYVRKYTLKLKILDIPNERSSHEIPTPRGGGIAIVFTWFCGITVLFIMDEIKPNLYYALLCGILLAIISLIDDLVTLKPSLRLLIQFITALLAIIFLNVFNPIFSWESFITDDLVLSLLYVIGIVWFVNLFNFLDGIDGYASLETVFMGAAIFLFTTDAILLVLISSTLGFLIWNWPKAKIFMGDVGSTQLGFILSVIGIYFHNTHEFSIIHWLMLSSIFWFDASLTLFRRWRNHERLSVAHRKHVYQRVVQSGLSHKQTIIISSVINLFILLLVYFSIKNSLLTIPLFIADMIILFVLTIIVDNKVPFKA